MTEDVLRAVIRETIARHLATGLPSAAMTASSGRQPAVSSPALSLHVSHGRFVLLPQADGPCMFEEHSDCDQCGFCQSLGH